MIPETGRGITFRGRVVDVTFRGTEVHRVPGEDEGAFELRDERCSAAELDHRLAY